MRSLFTAACLLSLAGFAAAHDGPEREGPPKDGKMGDGKYAACKADAEKLCKDVEPGGGRIMACLKAHESELSEGCRIKKGGQKGEAGEKHPGFAACEADKSKFCAEVKPGEGRIVECMRAHKEELSSACREMMEKKGPGKKEEGEKRPPRKGKDAGGE